MLKLSLLLCLGLFLFSFGSADIFYGETLPSEFVLFYNGTWNKLPTTTNTYSMIVSNSDRLAFGFGGLKYYNITLNVTQPLSHANITWYYTGDTCEDGSCTYAGNLIQFYPITDCSNFTTAGLCSISFNASSMERWGIQFGGQLTPLTFSEDGIYIIAYITKNATDETLAFKNTSLNLDALRINNDSFTIQTLYSNATALGNNDCMKNIASYYNSRCDLVLGIGYGISTANNPSTVNLTISEWSMFELGSSTNLRVLYNRYRNNQINIGEYNTTSNYTSKGSTFKYNNHFFQNNLIVGKDNYYGNFNVYESLFIARKLQTYSMSMWYGLNLYNSIVSFIELTPSSGWYWTSTTTGNIVNSIYSPLGSRLLFYASDLKLDNIVFNNVGLVWMGVNGATIKNANLAGAIAYEVVNANRGASIIDSEVSNYSSQFTSSSTASVNTNLSVKYNTSIELYSPSGDLINPSTYNVSITNSLGDIVRSPTAWTGSQVLEVFKLNRFNQTVLNYIYYNPMTIKITAPNMVDYQIVMNLTNKNRQLSFTQSYYPFELNGTIVLSKGKTLKFIRN